MYTLYRAFFKKEGLIRDILFVNSIAISKTINTIIYFQTISSNTKKHITLLRK